MLENELTKTEMLLMRVVWQNPDKELVLSDYVEEINKQNNMDWKPQTISTYLAHLVRKGYLSMHRDGKRYYYTSLVDKDEYSKKQFENLCKWYDETMQPGDVFKKLFGMEERKC